MNMFFHSYTGKQKLILLLLLLPSVILVLYVFWHIPAWSNQNWNLSVLIFILPFVYLFQRKNLKYSNGIINDTFELNTLEIFDDKFRCIEGIRIIQVYSFLKENNCLNNGKILDIINIIKFETSVPKYKFFAGKVFYGLFIFFIGIAIPTIVKYSEEIKTPEKYGVLVNLFISIAQALGIIVMIVFIVEWLVKDSHDRLAKNRYKVHLIRYLEEVRLLLG